MPFDIPRPFRLKQILKSSAQVATLVFEGTLHSLPGQFVMLWLPGRDEKPISISLDDPQKNKLHLSIADIGPVTHHLCAEMKIGDYLGIRGPYGTSFKLQLATCNLQLKHIALVGGGCGCAPLRFLAYEAIKKRISVDYYIGVRTKNLVLFEQEMQILGCNVFVSTDDGSYGQKGFITEQLQKNLTHKKTEQIYACGPEIMLKIVAEIGQKYKIGTQLSLERYMKCGFGVCGQCCLDDTGLRLCKDGPVISGKTALASQEFGHYYRDKMGKKQFFGRK